MRFSGFRIACLAGAISLFSLQAAVVQAQDENLAVGPKYETRAFWLTTVLGLDWPKTTDREAAEASLREIIRQAYSQNFNTVVMQVVSRGDAMYPSERLPWSIWLTGEPGKDPDWDPMAVAIEETHGLGMDFHAWYNVYRIGDTNTPVSETAEPLHVTLARPEWVENRDGQLWLNPAFPELREWLVGNVMEIVENYDIDAIHFDFIRTATSGYSRDSALKQELDPDSPLFLNDWRRENINQFARDAYAAVKEVKPWVKVGSTPVGNYNSTECQYSQVLSGRDAVFQDSRRWMQEEVHDYLAPQIYWPFGRDGTPPFECLSRRWTENSHGRHVYVGIGAYVDAVRPQLTRQIDTTRAHGAQGQMYFRWAHVVGSIWFPSVIGDRYDFPALNPLMEWLPHAAPATPTGFTLEFDAGENRIELTWETPDSAEDDRLRGFAVYRSMDPWVDPDDREQLVAVLGPDATSFVEVFAERPEQGVSYRIVAFSRLGAESVPTHSRWTDFTTVGTDPEIPEGTFTLDAPYPNPATGVVRIAYSVERSVDAAVRLYDVLGREVKTLASGMHAAGLHDATLDVSSLASGVYVLSLEADGRTETRRLVVAQ